MVGALCLVGQGAASPDVVREALLTRRRVAALKSAPAHGLCLSRVYYASDEDVPPPLIALRQQVDTWHAAAAVAGT